MSLEFLIIVIFGFFWIRGELYDNKRRRISLILVILVSDVQVFLVLCVVYDCYIIVILFLLKIVMIYIKLYFYIK